MTKDENGVFTQHFMTRHSECDPSLRVTPAAVLDYFQEVAGRHCIPYGVAVPQIMADWGLTWVLTAMAVRFDAYPHWPEEVIVQTWPRRLHGFKALRDFYLKDSAGRICVKGSSQWAVLELETRRPAKMDKIGELMPCSCEEEALPEVRPGRIPLPETFNLEDIPITVSSADLDYNYHVNNLRYIIWLLSSLDKGLQEGQELAALNIAYLGECHLGDQLIIRSFLEGGHGVHSFWRKGDEREVCRMESSWRPRKEKGSSVLP